MKGYRWYQIEWKLPSYCFLTVLDMEILSGLQMGTGEVNIILFFYFFLFLVLLLNSSYTTAANKKGS